MNPFLDTSRALLYVIVDAEVVPFDRLEGLASELAELGIDILQYRDKKSNNAHRRRSLRALVEGKGEAEIPVLANDDPNLVEPAGADGVHLGQDDPAPREARELLGPEALIGLSTHSLEEVDAAEFEPVDYLGLGPVFESPTKMIREPLGLEILAAACSRSSHPIVAIGGLSPDNARDALDAGARGLASISALGLDGSLEGCKRFLAVLRGIAD